MITITDLCVKTGRKILLNNIHLTVKKGELRGIIGPSGSGKTTLLRTIAGLEEPCAGKICLNGITVSSPGKIIPPQRRRISMVFQSLALWPHMTVRKHLEFVIKQSRSIERANKNNKIDYLLNMMHMESLSDRYPAELSGGEQQRLAIGRAMASDPEYLLMDEPFSSLDDRLKEELLETTLFLKQKEKITILYVTHSIDEVLYLADNISIIKNGMIAFQIKNTRDLIKKDLLKYMDKPS